MTFLICLIGTLCLVPILRRLAIETNFVDIPDDRKHHDGLIPPIGGIAIFIPFLVLSGVYAFQADLLLQDIWPFFTAVIMLLLLGVVDDKYHINANFKFLVHFLAAILVVYNGANLSSMGNLFGYGESNFGWFAPIFSVFCVVYLINAINMIDGIDGLSCGLGVIMTGYLILACMLAGLIPPAGLLYAGRWTGRVSLVQHADTIQVICNCIFRRCGKYGTWPDPGVVCDDIVTKPGRHLPTDYCGLDIGVAHMGCFRNVNSSHPARPPAVRT